MNTNIDKAQDGGLGIAAAMKQADKPNYLGDQQVVWRVLNDCVNRIRAPWQPGERTGDWRVWLNAQQSARILLGQDPDYAPGPMNQPGQLDAFLRKEMAIDDSDPVDTVAIAICRCIKTVLDASMAEDPDERTTAIEGARRAVTMLLMGIPPATLPPSA